MCSSPLETALAKLLPLFMVAFELELCVRISEKEFDPELVKSTGRLLLAPEILLELFIVILLVSMLELFIVLSPL